jgi:DNA-binding MarR family transcriptional regulator
MGKINQQTSPMRFFVLANISRGGLRSLYELQVGVGLQPGAILPLLRQLESDGLLKRSPQEARRRRNMTVTGRGEQLLREHWQDCLHPYLDSDAVLRAAAVAILMGDQRMAAHYLQDMASDYELKMPNAPAQPQNGEFSPHEWYAFMRWSWEVEWRQAAAKMFRGVAKKLEESGRQMT